MIKRLSTYSICLLCLGFWGEGWLGAGHPVLPKGSVPDKRGVSGQKPDKDTYMTDKLEKISNDLVEIMGIESLEFDIDTQA